ncbi:hypothetical protein QTO34_007970, partial [Cnephaeus nilssonii]
MLGKWGEMESFIKKYHPVKEVDTCGLRGLGRNQQPTATCHSCLLLPLILALLRLLRAHSQSAPKQKRLVLLQWCSPAVSPASGACRQLSRPPTVE